MYASLHGKYDGTATWTVRSQMQGGSTEWDSRSHRAYSGLFHTQGQLLYICSHAFGEAALWKERCTIAPNSPPTVTWSINKSDYRLFIFFVLINFKGVGRFNCIVLLINTRWQYCVKILRARFCLILLFYKQRCFDLLLHRQNENTYPLALS